MQPMFHINLPEYVVPLSVAHGHSLYRSCTASVGGVLGGSSHSIVRDLAIVIGQATVVIDQSIVLGQGLVMVQVIVTGQGMVISQAIVIV